MRHQPLTITTTRGQTCVRNRLQHGTVLRTGQAEVLPRFSWSLNLGGKAQLSPGSSSLLHEEHTATGRKHQTKGRLSWTDNRHFPRENVSQCGNSASLNTPWKQNLALPNHRRPASSHLLLVQLRGFRTVLQPLIGQNPLHSGRQHGKSFWKKKVMEWSLIGSRLLHAAA